MDTNTICQITGVTSVVGYPCSCGGTKITDWLTSFGTVGAVVVAFLVPWLKNFILRPKVELKMDICDPYYTTKTIEESASASNVGKRTVGLVWLGVKNTKSRTFANHCFVSVGAVYISKGGDPNKRKYKIYKQFHPQMLQWDTQNGESDGAFVDIPSNMTHFAKVASISVPRDEELKNMKKSNVDRGGATCPSFASVALSIPDGSNKEKCRIAGTCQDILVSVRVAGSGLKGDRYFLQISWAGKNEEDILNPAQNLTLHVLSESAGLALIDKSGKEVL